ESATLSPRVGVGSAGALGGIRQSDPFGIGDETSESEESSTTPPLSKEFCADKPFLVLVRRQDAGEIVFAGAVGQPFRKSTAAAEQTKKCLSPADELEENEIAKVSTGESRKEGHAGLHTNGDAGHGHHDACRTTLGQGAPAESCRGSQKMKRSRSHEDGAAECLEKGKKYNSELSEDDDRHLRPFPSALAKKVRVMWVNDRPKGFVRLFASKGN
ncbi:unnamed protein product, partial [Amoebophrya sp. A25]